MTLTTPLESFIGTVVLRWDDPSSQEGCLALLNDLEVKNDDEQKQKWTLSWYLKEKWGDPSCLGEVIDLVVDWSDERIHAGGKIESAEDLAVEDPQVEGDLDGIPFFAQAGHTVTGRGSGYHSPYGNPEKNEQKWASGITAGIRSSLESRGASVASWDRIKGDYPAHCIRTRDLIRKNCPKAVLAAQIHWNAASASATGIEVIAASAAGYKAAQFVAARISQAFPALRLRHSDGALLKSRGRGTGWLRAIDPPAIIVESHFASNQSDMAIVDTPDGRAALSDAIADGMADYHLSLVGNG